MEMLWRKAGRCARGPKGADQLILGHRRATGNVGVLGLAGEVGLSQLAEIVWLAIKRLRNLARTLRSGRALSAKLG